MKPNKWHFKAFCLNDDATEYLSNFFLYRRRDEQRPAGMPATLFPVIKLTEPIMYHGKGHIMALDNWYTSTIVCRILIQAPLRMDVVGTCRVNRQGLPKANIYKSYFNYLYNNNNSNND
jgi:hypothetical protein